MIISFVAHGYLHGGPRLEKGTTWYLHNGPFHALLGLYRLPGNVERLDQDGSIGLLLTE